MLEKRTETVYLFYLTCDGCGDTIGACSHEEDARVIAKRAGWTHVAYDNGLAVVRCDYCEDCAERMAEAQPTDGCARDGLQRRPICTAAAGILGGKGPANCMLS